MSASNWDVCPKCRRVAEEKRSASLDKARAAYGKIPSEEWEAMKREAEKPLEIPTSLREDYQLGVTEGGEFYVIYRCACQRCDFAHEFRHEEQVLKATA